MIHPKILLLACLASCVALAGCSPKNSLELYPVHGKVMADKKPAVGALITFYAASSDLKLEKAPSANVKPDGSFVIGTLKPEDGAPAGDYTITIIWLPSDAAASIARGILPNRLPSQYGDPFKSGLKVQVKKQANELDVFDIKTK